jgi:hypothetical protein
MADAHSPLSKSWRNSARSHHEAELKGYGQALAAAYGIDPLPRHFEDLLRRLVASERQAPLAR